MGGRRSERRSAQRVACRVPVTATRSDGSSDQGVLHNLSATGGRLHLPGETKNGSLLELQIAFPEFEAAGIEPRQVTFQARVIWVLDESEVDGLPVGVEFESPEEKDLEHVQAVMRALRGR